MLRRLLRAPAPAEDQTAFEVALGDKRHRIFLRRSKTARRFTLRIRAATRDVVLTVPARAKLAEAKLFAQRHADWIGARLQRLPEIVPFEEGAVIPLRGIPCRISLAARTRGAGGEGAATAGSVLRVVCPDPGFAARRVRDALIKEARRDLEAAVARHCARLGLATRPVSLRDTTSRWGSCSASGSLNFSWRLVLAPPHVLDYLAAHEVAHLIHMNHSHAFWAVVARLDPHYEEAEAWLRRNGAQLLRFGAKTCR